METIQQFDVTTLPTLANEEESYAVDSFAYKQLPKDDCNFEDLPVGLVAVQPYKTGWRLLHALKAALKYSPIWKRVWIMQELSSAPNITLVAGRSN
jgi:hypothetical protein